MFEKKESMPSSRTKPCTRCEVLIRGNIRLAKRYWNIRTEQLTVLKTLTSQLQLSIAAGDLHLIENRWYVTHTGLLRLATSNGCSGIEVQPVRAFCDPTASRWAFKATVYKVRGCRGFAGFGDADPFNVSPLVRGAEMRIAETRAVNRALRKAYGIGICSVEEIGSAGPVKRSENVRKLPLQPVNGSSEPKLRDQLCLLIRQHRLDASSVKQYAAEFCSTKDIRQPSREQIQSFITHLTELAEKDREGLLCKLNSYGQKPQEGAA